MLSWWQRKAASAFVAEPPTSSIEEALENFLKVQCKKIQHDNISVFTNEVREHSWQACILMYS